MPRKKLTQSNEERELRDEKSASVSDTVAMLNRLVHEPARLAILTVLVACEAADFVLLRTATGLTAGNLSIQLSRLEMAGLVQTEKRVENRRTVTMVELTGLGRVELKNYWEDMERLREQVRTAELPQSRPGPRTTNVPVAAHS